MSPLAKEVIEKLSHEQDTELLAEVLDFYEYVKQKKARKLWQSIEEADPDEEEKKICNEYKNTQHELVGLDDLVQELGFDK